MSNRSLTLSAATAIMGASRSGRRRCVCGTLPAAHNVCDLSNGAPSPDRDVFRTAEVALRSGGRGRSLAGHCQSQRGQAI